jgi:BirA family transcriptional regulator, biotin operon repressor / biotin---[acetyl-CoA-carboxylase] ligase
MAACIFDDAAMSELPTVSLIDPARLQALLGSARGRFDVDALAECESTSSLLLARAGDGAPAGSVVVADRQTAGRGRRGRHWLSSPEASLTFSVLWRFAGGIERLAGLSLAVGVAVLRALEACGASGLALKWPNDILLGDAKLGGILVELQSERRGMQVVVGIGLNLHLPGLDEGIGYAGQPVAALGQVLSPLPDRHDLLAQVLLELAAVLDDFAEGGFAALRGEWQARHAWQDRPVRLLRDGVLEKAGVCRGADTDGALLIQTAAGLERCLSGDLSLRAA